VNGFELLLKCGVDEAMSLQKCFAGELFRDDYCVKLSTATVRFVNNFLQRDKEMEN